MIMIGRFMGKVSHYPKMSWENSVFWNVILGL